MKHASRTFARYVALATLITASLSATAEELRYHTVVVEDVAMGRALVRGEIGNSIDTLKARSDQRRPAFSTENNLCVALIVARKFDAASTACDSAVSVSDTQVRMRYILSQPQIPVRTRQAMALTNRGVLLALTGKTDAAHSDFVASTKLDPELDQARTNLSRFLATSPATTTAARR